MRYFINSLAIARARNRKHPATCDDDGLVVQLTTSWVICWWKTENEIRNSVNAFACHCQYCATNKEQKLSIATVFSDFSLFFRLHQRCWRESEKKLYENGNWLKANFGAVEVINRLARPICVAVVSVWLFTRTQIIGFLIHHESLLWNFTAIIRGGKKCENETQNDRRLLADFNYIIYVR